MALAPNEPELLIADEPNHRTGRQTVQLKILGAAQVLQEKLGMALPCC